MIKKIFFATTIITISLLPLVVYMVEVMEIQVFKSYGMLKASGFYFCIALYAQITRYFLYRK